MMSVTVDLKVLSWELMMAILILSIKGKTLLKNWLFIISDSFKIDFDFKGM
jgi:hypothetical protein